MSGHRRTPVFVVTLLVALCACSDSHTPTIAELNPAGPPPPDTGTASTWMAGTWSVINIDVEQPASQATFNALLGAWQTAKVAIETWQNGFVLERLGALTNLHPERLNRNVRDGVFFDWALNRGDGKTLAFTYSLPTGPATIPLGRHGVMIATTAHGPDVMMMRYAAGEGAAEQWSFTAALFRDGR